MKKTMMNTELLPRIVSFETLVRCHGYHFEKCLLGHHISLYDVLLGFNEHDR